MGDSLKYMQYITKILACLNYYKDIKNSNTPTPILSHGTVTLFRLCFVLLIDAFNFVHMFQRRRNFSGFQLHTCRSLLFTILAFNNNSETPSIIMLIRRQWVLIP